MQPDHEWLRALYEAADFRSSEHDPESAAASAADFQSWLDASALNRHAYLDVVEAEKRVMNICRRVRMAHER